MGLVASACGDDDDETSADATPTATDDAGDGDGDDGGDSGDEAAGDDASAGDSSPDDSSGEDSADSATPAETPTTQPDDGDECEAESDDPIVIGAILPESGPLAVLGVPESKGLQAFEDAGHMAMGRPVEIDIVNDQSDPVQSTAAARDMLADSSVVAIIGPSGSAMQAAVFPEAREADKPVIFLTPAPYPDHNQIPNIFGPNITPTAQLVSIARDFFGEEVDDWIGISNDDATGEAMKGILESQDPPMSIEIVPSTVQDYLPVVQRLQDEGVEGLIVTLSISATGLLLSAREAIDWDATILLGRNNFNLSLIEVAGDTANGAYGVAQASVLPSEAFEESDPELSAAVAEFQDAFAAAGGEPAERLAGSWAWDAALSVVTAINDSCSTDGPTLSAALEAQSLLGAGGRFARGPGDHVGVPAGRDPMAQVQDGEFVIVTEPTE